MPSRSRARQSTITWAELLRLSVKRIEVLTGSTHPHGVSPWVLACDLDIDEDRAWALIRSLYESGRLRLSERDNVAAPLVHLR